MREPIPMQTLLEDMALERDLRRVESLAKEGAVLRANLLIIPALKQEDRGGGLVHLLLARKILLARSELLAGVTLEQMRERVGGGILRRVHGDDWITKTKKVDLRAGRVEGVLRRESKGGIKVDGYSGGQVATGRKAECTDCVGGQRRSGLRSRVPSGWHAARPTSGRDSDRCRLPGRADSRGRR